MTNAIIDQLSEAEAALANDDYDRFRGILPDLFEAYDTARPEERAFTERAKSLTQEQGPGAIGDTPESLDTVPRYLVEAQQINANRAGALIGLGVGLPNESADVDLQQFVSELKSKEQSRMEARDAAAQTVSESSIPALPRVYQVDTPEDPLVVDTEVTVTITIGNAGDQRVDDVEIFAEVPDTLSVSTGTPDSVSLSPDETRTLQFTVVASEPGEFSISAGIETDQGEFSETSQMEVLNVTGIINRAKSRLSELRNRITDLDAKRGSKRRLLSSIDAAQNSLERALRALKSTREKKVKSHLNTSTKQLGALLNKLEAWQSGGEKSASGKGNKKNNSGKNTLSSRQRAGFAAITEESIDLITTGKSAV